MEKWDAYDKDFNKIDGMTLIRGESIPEGIFHLVVSFIIQHEDGDFLLMFRDPNKSHGGKWELSGCGSAIQGENPLTAVKREMLEETGVVAKNITQIGKKNVTEHKMIFTFFHCITDCEKSSITLQKGETIDYKWISKEELIKMDDSEFMSSAERKMIFFYLEQSSLIV